jgi:hypothetical protein
MLHSDTKSSSSPVCKLIRSLRAEIDESARSTICTNESVPFEKPAMKSKIAVKVINQGYQSLRGLGA